MTVLINNGRLLIGTTCPHLVDRRVGHRETVPFQLVGRVQQLPAVMLMKEVAKALIEQFGVALIDQPIPMIAQARILERGDDRDAVLPGSAVEGVHPRLVPVGNEARIDLLFDIR